MLYGETSETACQYAGWYGYSHVACKDIANRGKTCKCSKRRGSSKLRFDSNTEVCSTYNNSHLLLVLCAVTSQRGGKDQNPFQPGTLVQVSSATRIACRDTAHEGGTSKRLRPAAQSRSN